jgi:signal recognition particle subunit SRP54
MGGCQYTISDMPGESIKSLLLVNFFHSISVVFYILVHMFSSLSQRLTSAFDKIRGRGLLTERDVIDALRDVRIALLEADVALSVVKKFIEDVRQEAVGQDVLRSVTPGQMVIKTVHDHLVKLLGQEGVDLDLAAAPPVSVLMLGLQGSGKTTTSGKLAKYLKEKHKKRVLLVSLDIYRPAAQKQLEILAQSIDVDSLLIVADEKPKAIIDRAQKYARQRSVDVIIYDTAGRLHVDDTLMNELKEIKECIQPKEMLLVTDAMTGQDAVRTAQGFHDAITISGLVLTRIDGDSRGGAALSLRAITGCPIKFLGTGEKIDQIEPFYADRLANRILDMGDIVSLVERAADVMASEDAEKLAKRMQKGHFNLNDMASQLEQMLKMGGLSSMMSLLPGIGKIKEKIDEAGLDDRMIHRQIALIRSMTPKERSQVTLLNASRRRRIAAGAGQGVADLNRLLKQFEQMQAMMKKLGKLGQKGLMRGGLKGLFGMGR